MTSIPAWDVWAVSIIAYEMLTGRHPFRQAVGFAHAGHSEDVPTAGGRPFRASAGDRSVFPPRALSQSPGSACER